MSYPRVLFRFAFLVTAGGLAGCGSMQSALNVLPAPALAEPDSALASPPMAVRSQAIERPTRFSDLDASAVAALRPIGDTPCVPFTVTFQTDKDQGAPKPVTLTAALVDPTDLERTQVDATGCDVGVYFDANSLGAKLFYVQIHDAAQIGILAFGARDVLINRVTVTNTGNHDCNGFKPNAVHSGVGIDFEGASGKVNQTQISQYQADGAAFNYGSSVAINNSVATGLGPDSSLRQIGISWYKSTVRGVAGNVATEHLYHNAADKVYNGTAKGFRVLCSNLKDAPTGRPVLAFEKRNVAVSDDIPFDISNSTTNGDCPPTYTI